LLIPTNRGVSIALKYVKLKNIAAMTGKIIKTKNKLQ
jgi:hypothetical protein